MKYGLTRSAFGAIASLMIGLGTMNMGTAHGAVIEFSDTEFQNGDWSGVEVRDTTPNNSFVFNAGQQLAGGNPGAYRRVTNELGTNTASLITSGHIFAGGTFDPGEDGHFVSFDITLDGISIGAAAGAMAYGLLLEQGGNFYTRSLGQVLNGGVWQSLSATGIVESDFFSETGGTLDLSDSGSVISVGFFVANGTFGTPSINEGGVDNWNLKINLPEPGGLGLVIAGLVALLGTNRFQRR